MGRPQPSFKTLKHISICSTLPPRPMPRKESVRALKTRKKENSGRQDSFSTSSTRPIAYLVGITSRAERDLAQLYSQIKPLPTTRHARPGASPRRLILRKMTALVQENGCWVFPEL